MTEPTGITFARYQGDGGPPQWFVRHEPDAGWPAHIAVSHDLLESFTEPPMPARVGGLFTSCLERPPFLTFRLPE